MSFCQSFKTIPMRHVGLEKSELSAKCDCPIRIQKSLIDDYTSAGMSVPANCLSAVSKVTSAHPESHRSVAIFLHVPFHIPQSYFCPSHR